MRRSMAILAFVVATTFLCGEALALSTYIPHITGGSADWTDYLQVSNNSSSAANFTLTLYNGDGTQIYSNVHSVGGSSRSQIELKILHPSAATGMITYTEMGLLFRVSYESMGGGVAEFKTIDTLGSNIGFFFSDFTTLIQWKGSAITNMGSASANVTLYALGGSNQGSGGSILGTYTKTIAPKAKLAGVHSDWFDADLTKVESIVAVTDSSSLCGIAISGDNALSHLLFTPASLVSNFNSPSTVSDPLIGNFMFVYSIGSVSTYTDRITLDKKSGSKTSEGTDVYTGYDARYAWKKATGAWYPSLSKYIVLSGDPEEPSFTYEYFSFKINGDNTLSGCYKLDSDSSNCYAFLVPESHRTPSGTWDMPLESESKRIDARHEFGIKVSAIQKAQAEKGESSCPEDLDLISKINELKAVIENHR